MSGNLSLAEPSVAPLPELPRSAEDVAGCNPQVEVPGALVHGEVIRDKDPKKSTTSMSGMFDPLNYCQFLQLLPSNVYQKCSKTRLCHTKKNPRDQFEKELGLSVQLLNERSRI